MPDTPQTIEDLKEILRAFAEELDEDEEDDEEEEELYRLAIAVINWRVIRRFKKERLA